MAQARVLKRRRSVIGSNGKEQLVNLARKVGASARSSDQASLGIDTNGNDNTATRLRAAKVRNDFLTRKLTHTAQVSSQPFGECFPCVPRITSIAPPPLGSHNRTKAKSSCSDPTSTSASPAAMIGGSLPTHAAGSSKVLPALGVLFAAPHSEYAILWAFSSPCRHFCEPTVAPATRGETDRRNEERVLLQDAADNYDRVRPHDVHHHAGRKFRQVVRTDHRIVVLGST